MPGKNILYLYSKLTPDDQRLTTLFAGGAQKRVFQMAVHFHKIGHRVIIASDDLADSLIVKTLAESGVVHKRIRFRGSFLFKALSLIDLIVLVLKYKIDIIHSNDRFTAFFSYLTNFLVCRNAIYTARNTYSDKRITGKIFGKNIVAISEGVKKNLINYFKIEEKNIRVIYNGTDMRLKLNFDKSYLFEKWKITKDCRVITFVGRLTEQKGLCYLLNAMPEIIKVHPTVKLLIVGDGENADKLITIVYSLQISDHVTFCGSQNFVDDYYHISEFTVIPSLWEGLGVSAIESIMLGKPVVATAVGGLPEIIENNVNGLLVPPMDSCALASSICYLLSNPRIVMKMGTAGKNIAEERFSLNAMLTEYEEYYEHAFR